MRKTSSFYICDNLCCVPLGSETHIYEFPSRKYRSIEVGSRISKWDTRNSARTPTSDWEIRVGKYEFPSPVECSISQMSSDLANFWQKHTPGNFETKTSTQPATPHFVCSHCTL